jgi:hypothetical protein
MSGYEDPSLPKGEFRLNSTLLPKSLPNLRLKAGSKYGRLANEGVYEKARNHSIEEALV